MERSRGSRRRSRIVVVTAADDDFVLPLSVMLASLLENARSDPGIDLYLIEDDITPDHLEHLERQVESSGRDVRLTVLRPEKTKLEGFERNYHISPAAYLRLLIPELLPASVEEAVYLDGDMLVLDDISELWSVPLEGRPMAAVRNMGADRVRGGIPYWEQAGLDPDVDYWNTGVLLMALSTWREEGLADRVLEFLHDHRELLWYSDQDGINAVMGARTKALPDRWNVQVGSRRIRDAPPPLEDLGIVHFSGPAKPWTGSYWAKLGRYDPVLATYRRVFMQHLDAVGWHSPLERVWFRAKLGAYFVRAISVWKVRQGLRKLSG